MHAAKKRPIVNPAPRQDTIEAAVERQFTNSDTSFVVLAAVFASLASYYLSAASVTRESDWKAYKDWLARISWLANKTFWRILVVVPLDRKSLPNDPEILQQMLVDLSGQLDKTQKLLRQLLEAKHHTRSEQLSADQLQLFLDELKQTQGDVKADAAEPPSADEGAGDAKGKPDSQPVAARPATTVAASEMSVAAKNGAILAGMKGPVLRLRDGQTRVSLGRWM